MAPSLGYRKRLTCPAAIIGRISDAPPVTVYSDTCANAGDDTTTSDV
jgi:hypothetical protein